MCAYSTATFLIRKVDVDIYPAIDWTRHRLHAAAISGNSNEVKLLIDEGADVNENLDLDVNGRQHVAGTPSMLHFVTVSMEVRIILGD